MENGRKECYMCRALERYYTKGLKRYNRAEIGWCYEQQKNVNIHDTCEQFSTKTKRKSNRVVKMYLSDLLTEISELRCILEDEKSEREENESM